MVVNLAVTRRPSDEEWPVLNEAIDNGLSFLALKMQGKRLPIVVCLDRGGFFLGASYEDDFGERIFFRDSDYFDSFEEADRNLKAHSWRQRMDP